jgi:hypothetical protein
MLDGLPEMEIDPTQFTHKRLMVTMRVPQGLPAADTVPWVVLEAEDGEGPAVAMCGPDTPSARADAARLIRLWNDELDREEAQHP